MTKQKSDKKKIEDQQIKPNILLFDYVINEETISLKITFFMKFDSEVNFAYVCILCS